VPPRSRDFDDLLRVACRYDLAVSGDALTYMERIGCAKAAIPLCQVFARTSPEQKELVLVTLKDAGRITLMCGDGTNDVGGLKAAHVGVALLSPSESAEKLAKKRREDKVRGVAKKAEKGFCSPSAHLLPTFCPPST
jgi:cation-transporting ATPase 13A1